MKEARLGMREADGRAIGSRGTGDRRQGQRQPGLKGLREIITAKEAGNEEAKSRNAGGRRQPGLKGLRELITAKEAGNEEAKNRDAGRRRQGDRVSRDGRQATRTEATRTVRPAVPN